MAVTPLLRFLVIFLGFSCLFRFSNAAPITRVARLMQGTPVLQETQHMVAKEKSWDGVSGRMDLELNDYPGVKSNGKNTPRPPSR